MDISTSAVQSPVHSLCISAGDADAAAFTTSDFAVNTVWREKDGRCPATAPARKKGQAQEKLLRVTKPSQRGVAIRPPKRHPFVVDQREWDYGARLPRERRAAEPWSLDNGPESTESGENPPKWQSITDTGSLEPSPEALAWARRADQWAQQPNLPERGQQGQWDGQVSRWSEVVPTGTFPADGVGWRTQTAEWRATSARWRQTTEWRSSSGTHGWRSTTEAWQTGDANIEGFPPPVAPPTGGPLAISGSAWSGDTADDPSTNGAESWQQPDGSYRTETYTPPSTAADGRPGWQQSASPAPPW